MLRKACSREEAPIGHHPSFAFWKLSGSASGPSAPSSQPSRAAASVPKGAAIAAQHRAADRTPIIQRRMYRWPSCCRGLGWQLLPLPLLPETQAGCLPVSGRGVRG